MAAAEGHNCQAHRRKKTQPFENNCEEAWMHSPSRNGGHIAQANFGGQEKTQESFHDWNQNQSEKDPERAGT